MTTDDPRPPYRTGFALMTPERRREIAKLGGASVPKHKRAYSRDRRLASEAGAKGGAAGKGRGGPTE